MKRISAFAGTAALAAVSAMAQDNPADKVKVELQAVLERSRVVGGGGGIMGRTVKGAPYSGQEINESNQVLADGTQIHNESRTNVYRDSEGRVRRETGEMVTIWDPVAGVSYNLDTKSMTAHKNPMASAVFTKMVATPMGVAAGGFVSAVPADGKWVSDDGRTQALVKQQIDAADVRHETFAVTQAEIRAANVGYAYTAGAYAATAALPEKLAAEVRVRTRMSPPNVQDLGDQVIEGVKSHGTRNTMTIETGAIGNDRPLTTVSERWYSEELQTEIQNKRTDPRLGENTFHLVNVNRSEPAAYLFQVPNGYNVIERK